MGDPFELLDLQSAHAFLDRFSANTRHQGDVCCRSGRVSNLVCKVPGAAFSAKVEDGRPEQVELGSDAEGWWGTCSCAQRRDCKHVYAALCAVLAEHRAALVRRLSAGIDSRASGQMHLLTAAGKAPDQLEDRLSAALGRRLKPEESRFIRKIRTRFEYCRQTRRFNIWEFSELGLPMPEPGYDSNAWQPLEIWPQMPATEHEFWLYVANAAQERGIEIPKFMEPITELGSIQDRLVHWRRAREVNRWRNALGNLRLRDAPSMLAASRGEADLRLLIEEDEARLQIRRHGSQEFRTLSSTPFNQFWRNYEAGHLQLATEAEILLRFLCHRPYLDGSLFYSDDASARALGKILRNPMFDSRVVNSEGQPLARPAEPLRWDLVPAASEQDDYVLRLAQADGAPAPPVLCLLPGQTPLYLTPSAVFRGPPACDNLLDAARETCIPAPAVESTPGVAFLRDLNIELPPRVRERVQTLPLEVVVRCELQPIYPDSKTEDCVVHVAAASPDGHEEKFNGQSWVDATPKAAARRARPQSAIILYDRAAQEQLPALLEPLALKPDLYRAQMSLRVTKKFPERFSAWLKSVPPHITVQLAGDLASFASTDISGHVRLDVTETEIDWFDLRVVLDVVDTTLTPEEIKLLLNAKGNYVRLAGKGWRRLHFDLSDDENERLARLGLSTRELSAEPQRLHALQLADEAARKFLPDQQVDQIQRRASELKARVAPDLPAGVTAQLRPYQLEGFHYLAYLSANRFGGILADDMGLGKTLQTLVWLLWLRKQTPLAKDVLPAPALVVCPKSVMDNWHAEAARFTPELRVKSWSPSELCDFHDQVVSADLHVLNYSQIRSLGEGLASVRWLAVILDEGQYIKNPSSQTAQVARSLRAEHRLVLSGTPIENRLLDLWSLMAFAMPGVLSSRTQFARLYDAKGDPLARRRLASRVRPFLLRRTKAQVAKDLPDRTEEDLFCEIEGEQKALYRAELKHAQQLLLAVQTQKELDKQQFNFLTSLLRLRQICCHPRLVNPKSKALSAKTEALLEQLEPLMEEGQKVLVFSQFVGLLDLLRPAIEERQWPNFYLTGQTENRGELVRQFQSAEGAAVFLISLKAGGFGLNLTAASYVVLFDPWWNPAVETQAIDRTHRIGQTNKVIAYRLLIKDSIEEKIRALQKKKQALAQDVLGEERFAQSLTIEDLRYLFAD